VGTRRGLRTVAQQPACNTGGCVELKTETKK
jgi:hypothetical protein